MPQEREIIREMFLVGILQEQVRVFADARPKSKAKNKRPRLRCPTIRTSNHSDSCEYVAIFMALAEVYMFCWSMSITNIGALMHPTPFFHE